MRYGGMSASEYKRGQRILNNSRTILRITGSNEEARKYVEQETGTNETLMPVTVFLNRNCVKVTPKIQVLLKQMHDYGMHKIKFSKAIEELKANRYIK